jgi:hypothetical protein
MCLALGLTGCAEAGVGLDTVSKFATNVGAELEGAKSIKF